MVKREKKLMLRAFNGECDSFIADVDWNNVSKMEERINKSYEAINRVYEKQGVFINEEYKNLKLEELHLAFEYRDKIHKEKEEQRAIREQMREEEKAVTGNQEYIKIGNEATSKIATIVHQKR